MKAIRGATTVDKDCEEEIKKAVKELLSQTVKKNKLEREEMVCILFTNTSDIHSYYPAKAAREAGFYTCALFSSAEPEMEGALPLCIRIMILADIDREPIHVYMNRASGLRKDISKVINIAIDGPAGSGKSTVSKILAKKLNILCLDTGAMYRACALKCLRGGIDVTDMCAVGEAMENIDITVQYENGQRTFLDGEDVSGAIREPQVSMAASTVSALKSVREKMVALQRKIAAGQSCVLDGRDIGTNVLPNAQFKFFLTASPEVRAKRRYAENLQKGFQQDFSELLSEIKVRDEQDANRRIAPLKRAEDAILIDSSDLTVDEVVALMERKIQEGI